MGRCRPPVDQALPVTRLAMAARRAPARRVAFGADPASARVTVNIGCGRFPRPRTPIRSADPLRGSAGVLAQQPGHRRVKGWHFAFHPDEAGTLVRRCGAGAERHRPDVFRPRLPVVADDHRGGRGRLAWAVRRSLPRQPASRGRTRDSADCGKHLTGCGSPAAAGAGRRRCAGRPGTAGAAELAPGCDWRLIRRSPAPGGHAGAVRSAPQEGSVS